VVDKGDGVDWVAGFEEEDYGKVVSGRMQLAVIVAVAVVVRPGNVRSGRPRCRSNKLGSGEHGW